MTYETAGQVPKLYKTLTPKESSTMARKMYGLAPKEMVMSPTPTSINKSSLIKDELIIYELVAIYSNDAE
jgi:hypothetical protein